MSGGVDSSVAAHLLIEQGYRVKGLFMKNWEEDDGTEYCTAIEDLADAQVACDRLGIELHTANFAAEYWDDVFNEFLQEYAAQNTPNPDVLCNREIKFKQFSDYAKLLGADFIATGHYARIKHTDDGPVLYQAADQNKDQTYFLQAVPVEAFSNSLFPLGDWLKTDVRLKAKELGLHNHNRKDSTGICFIGERRFADFLANYLKDAPGEIIDTSGRCVGQHRGLHHYTFGQRQGLNIGGLKGRQEAPWYVCGKLIPSNRLVVCQDATQPATRWLLADSPNWLVPNHLPMRATAKIRYRQEEQPCTVKHAAHGGVTVIFDEPQRAITPGQYVALYSDVEAGDRGTRTLLGGARIHSTDSAHLYGLR